MRCPQIRTVSDVQQAPNPKEEDEVWNEIPNAALSWKDSACLWQEFDFLTVRSLPSLYSCSWAGLSEACGVSRLEYSEEGGSVEVVEAATIKAR
jgi:hypothetical protein